MLKQVKNVPKIYVKVKKYRKYNIVDTDPIHNYDFDSGVFEEYYINKKNHLIKIYSYRELIDWYADIGAIYNWGKDRYDLGLVVAQSDNIEDLKKED